MKSLVGRGLMYQERGSTRYFCPHFDTFLAQCCQVVRLSSLIAWKNCQLKFIVWLGERAMGYLHLSSSHHLICPKLTAYIAARQLFPPPTALVK